MAAPNGGEVPEAAGVIEALREVLLEEIEAKVAPKLEEIEQRGRQVILQAQERQNEHTQKLTKELQQCVEIQQKLIEENKDMKQTIMMLMEKMRLLQPLVANAKGPSFHSQFPRSPPPSPWEFPSSSSPDAAAGGGLPYHDPTSLPQVPAFPFTTHSSPLATNEADSASTATSPMPIRPPPGMPVQVSLAKTLPPVKFKFTIRKADGNELGLECTRDYSHKVLVVRSIAPNSAVDSWNRQCIQHQEKAIQLEDKIYRVNDVSLDPDRMFKECQEKRLCTIYVWRGEGGPEDEQAQQPSNSGFRAEASDFVPLSLANILEAADGAVSPPAGLAPP